MKPDAPRHLRSRLGYGLICLVFGAALVYQFVRTSQMASEIAALTDTMGAATAELTADLHSLRTTVTQTNTTLIAALNNQQQNVGNIQQQLGSVQSQVGNVTGTVSTLQKLSQTDPELLKKYSKVYFLNENYVPARLTEIPNAYEYSSKKQLLYQTDALPYLEKMINDASSSGVTIYVDSAYRSFDEQKALKGDYKMTYGAGTANSFSADQGYSEHQLGTAVDLIPPGLGGALDDSFDGTKAYTWLAANAYKYGFELSYPKDNSYYVYEPWHWRFVGKKLANDLHNQGKNFYDLDQRVIDTYLASIFD